MTKPQWLLDHPDYRDTSVDGENGRPPREWADWLIPLLIFVLGAGAAYILFGGWRAVGLWIILSIGFVLCTKLWSTIVAVLAALVTLVVCFIYIYILW